VSFFKRKKRFTESAPAILLQHPVWHPLKKSERKLIEIAEDIHTPSRFEIKEAGVVLQLNEGVVRTFQQKLHHLLIDDLISELFIGRFDKEASAELRRLKVNVVKADDSGNLVKPPLFANPETRKIGTHLNDATVESVDGAVLAAACDIVVVKNINEGAFTTAVYDVLRSPAVSILEEPQKGVALGDAEYIACSELKAEGRRKARQCLLTLLVEIIDQHAYDNDRHRYKYEKNYDGSRHTKTSPTAAILFTTSGVCKEKNYPRLRDGDLSATHKE